jgi:hypothetical protein
MGFRGAIAGAIVLALAAAIAVGGCGGGSSSSASESDNGSDQIEAAKPSEGEPSRTFLAKSEEKKTPKFGQEASAQEREAASKVLEENLVARETGDWATQCATLTPAAVKFVKEGAEAQGIKGAGCAEELKARAEPLAQSKSLRVNTLTGPIDALRFKGSRAFALYHGTGGVDYAMPMEKVDGEWKVDSILTEEP